MTAAAFLMPGQGAQAVGMGKAFYDHFDVARELYKRANTHLGFDLSALCFEGPPEELTKTERCQPAIFVTSLAAVAALRELAPSLRPVGVAGLSLGEVTSLAVAEAIAFTDALYVVQARGELMAECASRHRGAMLAVIGLTNEAIDAICRTSGAWAANYNAADQVVLSGTVGSIEQAETLAKTQGAKRVVRLEVAGAFHSPLMQPAADQFKHVLAKVSFRPARIPVVTNVTGTPVQDPEAIRELLVRQIVSPVRWETSMRALIQSGAHHFIEFPPARVLTALLRRIDSTVKGYTIDEPKDFEKLSGLVGPAPAASRSS